MKILVRLEELGLLLLAMYLFSTTVYDWWWLPLLILSPDLSMFGYLVNARAGAALYNFVHHRGLAVVLYLSGLYLAAPPVQLAGIIFLAHSSLDRAFGYGLKFTDSFRHTHLGWIGSGRQ